jgi:Ca-activated chloride channel family protein
MTRPQAGQVKKRLNLLLLSLSIVAGLLWGAAGEGWLAGVLGRMNDVPAVGLYFSFLTALIIPACVISEFFVSSLVYPYFLNFCSLPAMKFSIPIALVGVFAAGCLFQFIYGLGFVDTIRVKSGYENRTVYDEVEVFDEVEKVAPVLKPKAGEDEILDYYFIIDDTASMTGTDPYNQRIVLINKVVSELSDTKRVMLVKFDFTPQVLLDLSYCDAATKRHFTDAKKYFYSDGIYTDIVSGVEGASLFLDPGRRGIAILITDGDQGIGGYEQKLPGILKAYTDAKIPIYSVMLGQISHPLLRELSEPTGGRVVSVDNFQDFEKEIVWSMQYETEYITTTEKVSRMETVPRTERVRTRITTPGKESVQVRNLLTLREDVKADSTLYALLRVVFIAIIGLLLGYAVAFVFQYRRLDIPLSLGGMVTGIIAGIVLEFGLQNRWGPSASIRIVHDGILASVFWIIAALMSGRRPMEAAGLGSESSLKQVEGGVEGDTPYSINQDENQSLPDGKTYSIDTDSKDNDNGEGYSR